jgi:sulfite reductase alpha subunit-like flavoprotein
LSGTNNYRVFRIDSIYLPWQEELRAVLISDHPLPESISPIPDDVELPPKYCLELLSSSMAGNGGESLTEVERKFLASRTKSAARSHVDHPKSAAEQAQEDWHRLDVNFPADYARRDQTWEREAMVPVEVFDRDNILKDHPQKYLLEPQPAGVPELPPADLLPIPDAVPVTLVRNERVTPADHWQDVRHLTFHFKIPAKDRMCVAELAGHLTLTIWPKNYPEDVQELISMMDWGPVADEPLVVKGGPPGVYVEGGIATLRHLLTHNLDITAVPKRNFLRELIHFTKDEREKERLQEFVRPGGEQEFYDYTCRPRRTILEVLRDFTCVRIPFRRVLDLFPPIRHRDFSVCNAGESLRTLVEEDTLAFDVLAALVEYKTIIRKPRQGLCSRYLKHLPVGTQLRAKLTRSSGPHLVGSDYDANRPLIAIATGTGIAPIRALIQERAIYRHPGDTLLFFGCRNRSADFYFEHEWKLYPNMTVYPAFSRDRIVPDPRTTAISAGADETSVSSTITTPTPATGIASSSVPSDPDSILSKVEYDANKNYVQHLIRKHAKDVAYLLQRRPIVCVCGNAGHMPVSVRNALLDVLVMTGMVRDKDEAQTWFNNPQNMTFWQEVW